MAEAGARISEYILIEKVGGGTFGEVWKARHHVWADKLVAIKIPTDQQYVRSLQQEGVTIHGLNHPNIVRAMGFDPYADPPYLTMEFVPGRSLREALAGGALPTADAIAIARQVLRALSFAHSQGVIHRDIKPENILIHDRAQTEGYAAEGVVKVTDFGLGKAATATGGSILYSMAADASQGEVAGTLDYMPPEQRSGGDVDHRCDLYAAGVVLFELLTGTRPGGTDLPSEVNANVPTALDEPFRRSYTRLERRFESADQFIEALDEAGGSAMGNRAETHSVFVGPTDGTCPQCVRPMDDRFDNFCIYCGKQLVERVPRCPKCGAYPHPTDSFCIECGQTLQPVEMV